MFCRAASLTPILFTSLMAVCLNAQSPTPTQIPFDRRTVLVGTDASLAGGLKQVDLGPGKVGWIEGWTRTKAAISWPLFVQQEAIFTISLILESASPECSIEVEIDRRTFSTSCGKAGWNRLTVGKVRLSAGQTRITISSKRKSAPTKLFAVEFETPESAASSAAAAKRHRASTQWMIDARYGLMFHWTSQTQPRDGAAKPYCDAVRDFDVNRFADMVSETGAGFVVFTTSHAGFYFPGPNPVIDSILPGRTCPRDLVGDLADSLARHHVRLELYFHPGHDDAPWWQRTHFEEADKTAYFRQWREIIAQIGRQYGSKIAGFWFDDAAFTYYPYNPSWQELAVAARTGDPNRVLSFNSWILPKVTDFCDVYAGENAQWDPPYQLHKFLPIGGSGRYTSGPQAGLQAEVLAILNDDWGHFKANQPIGAPRMSTELLLARMKDAIRRREIPILDLEVYQDGTADPDTLKRLQAVRNAVSQATPLH